MLSLLLTTVIVVSIITQECHAPHQHLMVHCEHNAIDPHILEIEQMVNEMKYHADVERMKLSKIEHSVETVGIDCAGGGISYYTTCDELYHHGEIHDGVYDIYITGKAIKVYCQFNTHRHTHWMVIQRRVSNVIDFYKTWKEYSHGFGDLKGNFWLGLQNLHLITSWMHHQLRIELEDWDGHTAYADYQVFAVLDSSTNYKLRINGYSGNAGDAMSYHNGYQFSTRDHDHDVSVHAHCAQLFHGGWWYRGCQHSNLNGYYFHNGQCDPKGITWRMWKHKDYSLKRVEMKIKPSDVSDKRLWLYGYNGRGLSYHE